jgi:hypothetical protein
MTDVPKQIGPLKDITLTGLLMPWKAGQPSFIHMQGVGDSVFYLPLFSDEDQLRSVLARAGVDFDSIKQVDHGPEFLDSIPTEIIVITNLRFTDEGRVRYTEVRR